MPETSTITTDARRRQTDHRCTRMVVRYDLEVRRSKARMTLVQDHYVRRRTRLSVSIWLEQSANGAIVQRVEIRPSEVSRVIPLSPIARTTQKPKAVDV
jgi:hypothetical protein